MMDMDTHGRRSRMVKYYSTQRPVSPGTFPREGARTAPGIIKLNTW
ncbi:hypothetical protein [Acetatifactor muris]